MIVFVLGMNYCLRDTVRSQNMYTDKYSLTREQSIFLARKKWDENVFCGMKMENRNVTFPQTQAILNGVNVPSVSLDDIVAILNMRDAWKFLLETLDEPITVEYFCKLNSYISRNESLEWGVLRTGTVGISGVKYVPPLPDRKTVDQELRIVLDKPCDDTEKSLDLFLWGSRRQIFWDGNKRSSLMLANKLMVERGRGVITVDDAVMVDFSSRLSMFYETGSASNLKKFLYDTSIKGIDYPKEQSKEQN